MTRLLVPIGLVAGVTLLAIASMLSIVRADDPTGNYLVAFASADNNSSRIFVSHSDGTHLTRLTSRDAAEHAPAWSPDGKWIMFSSNSAQSTRFCRIRPNGSHLKCSRAMPNSSDLSWSPDSEWVVFVVSVDGNREIFIMRPGGEDLRRLTQNVEDDYSPAWSPDGQWIAFVSRISGPPQIAVMRPDGSGRQQLTNLSGYAVWPVWSPDSDWIAFVEYSAEAITIWRIRPDGSDLQAVLVDPSEQMEVIWSPDGAWLNFVSTRGGEGYDLYQVSPDGGELTRLTQINRTNFGMVWSPDAAWVYFISVRRSDTNIYRIRPASGDLKPEPLTRSRTDNTLFSISPAVDFPWRLWLHLGIAALLIAPAVIVQGASNTKGPLRRED